MENQSPPVRVLFSFPNRLGGPRICGIAWNQADGSARDGAKVHAFSGSLEIPFQSGVRFTATLAYGRIRLPYRIVGRSLAFAIHDWRVARWLRAKREEIDVVHTWPLGALRTLQAARACAIPTVLERPNAHTQFAYQVVEEECRRLGITMPPGHEHAYNEAYLRKEEAEYRLADRLLCPSDFVAQTFLDKGFPSEKLARHQYGYDEEVFYPGHQDARDGRGLTMLFAGGCAPRKGLHYALEAWVASTACRSGTFLIAGAFIPGYAERLSSLLAHPSVKVLGHRKDVPDLMRQSDLFTLPSIEEGSALVTSEARASGCVLVVSGASGAICRHQENALVHRVRDSQALTQHINLLNQDRALLSGLRSASLATVSDLTWTAAGRRLCSIYRQFAKKHHHSP